VKKTVQSKKKLHLLLTLSWKRLGIRMQFIKNPSEPDRSRPILPPEFRFKNKSGYCDKGDFDETNFLYESESLNEMPQHVAHSEEFDDHVKSDGNNTGPNKNFTKHEPPKEPHFYYSMHQVPLNMFKTAQPANNGALGLKPFQMHQLNPQSLIPFTTQQHQHYQQYQQQQQHGNLPQQSSYRLNQIKSDQQNEYNSDDDEDVQALFDMRPTVLPIRCGSN
jgi:hypothetical protein